METIPLDLCWTGRSRSIASALLRSGRNCSLLDPGPTSTLGTLRRELSRHGLAVGDLDSIFLTHIHLDHAGATGSLVAENPALRVYVHERGATHMTEPAALLGSARRLYGEKMDELFGEFLAVPAANLELLRGGEVLSLGPESLQVFYTPGHASHHVTYFDPSSATAFVGDTTGICIEGHPFVLPAAPPPDIHLELWNQSLEAIRKLDPQRLFLTHFGFSDKVQAHLASFRARLNRWSEVARRILASSGDDAEALAEFVAGVCREAEQFLTPAEAQHYLYNGHLPLSWLGLARYHRKRTVPQSP